MVSKFYLFSLVIGLNIFVLHAQNTVTFCNSIREQYKSSYKAKEYDKAYEYWRKWCSDCELSFSEYQSGIRMLKYRSYFAEEKDKSFAIKEFNRYSDSLQVKYKHQIAVKEALVHYQGKSKPPEDIYKTLNDTFLENEEDFKEPKALYVYTALAIDLDLSKKIITKKEALDVYGKSISKIKGFKEKYERTIAELKKEEEIRELTKKERRRLWSNKVNHKAYKYVEEALEIKAQGIVLGME